MANILPITLIGQTILEENAKTVKNIHGPKIQRLIDDMMITCESAKGLGIAAPQVGQSLRLVIISSKPCPRYPKAPFMEATVLINPTIISRSEDMDEDWESCLSIPGYCGLVPRHKWVKVAYTNRDGEQKEDTFEGIVARVVQHEDDHTKGMFYTDPKRTKPENILTTQEYEQRFAAAKNNEAAA